MAWNSSKRPIKKKRQKYAKKKKNQREREREQKQGAKNEGKWLGLCPTSSASPLFFFSNPLHSNFNRPTTTFSSITTLQIGSHLCLLDPCNAFLLDPVPTLERQARRRNFESETTRLNSFLVLKALLSCALPLHGVIRLEITLRAYFHRWRLHRVLFNIDFGAFRVDRSTPRLSRLVPSSVHWKCSSSEHSPPKEQNCAHGIV